MTVLETLFRISNCISVFLTLWHNLSYLSYVVIDDYLGQDSLKKEIFNLTGPGLYIFQIKLKENWDFTYV